MVHTVSVHFERGKHIIKPAFGLVRMGYTRIEPANARLSSDPSPLAALAQEGGVALAPVCNAPPATRRRAPGFASVPLHKLGQRLQPYPRKLVGFGSELLARRDGSQPFEQLVDAVQAEQVVRDHDDLAH